MLYTIDCLCKKHDTTLVKLAYTKYIANLKAYDDWVDEVFRDVLISYADLIHCNNIDVARLYINSKETVKMIDKLQ